MKNKSLTPRRGELQKPDGLLLQLTAKGKAYDCVTRSFAPKLNVAEDPVCGFGHCHVIPLWANKLQKTALCAFQASRCSGVDAGGQGVYGGEGGALLGSGAFFAVTCLPAISGAMVFVKVTKRWP